MSDKEELKLDVKLLTEAYKSIGEALKKLTDIEEFDDFKYDLLFDINEEINDLKIKKEVKLEGMCKNG